MERGIKKYNLNSERKYSFYTTHNLIKIYAEEMDLPEKLISDMYYHYVDKLQFHSKNPNILSFRLGYFGTITQTVPGVQNTLDRLGRLRKQHPYIDKLKDRFESKLEKGREIVNEQFANRKGAYRTPLLYKAKPIHKILNE